MKSTKQKLNSFVEELTRQLATVISETNGISIEETIELMLTSPIKQTHPEIWESINECKALLDKFKIDQATINELLDHPFSAALYQFFKQFPLPYKEEHTHLSGSLSAEFIYPRLKKVLEGPTSTQAKQQIDAVYGQGSSEINSVEDVDRLIRLQENERFNRYLQILFLTKLILTSREAHQAAAYHMAKEMYTNYNIGSIRLKFMLSRANTTGESEVIPGIEQLTSEDVVLGLYDGFMQFKKEFPEFRFVLSPLFRKEANYFDSSRFTTKKEDVEDQIDTIVGLLEKYPELKPYLSEVDTVGDEREFFRKQHYIDMKNGFRKLQYMGFQIRSHHGETWKTLRRGIQAVDNAMNIWHIDTLEHGLALGINPNYYFHSLYQRVLQDNTDGKGIPKDSLEYNEIMELEWGDDVTVRDKLIEGKPLEKNEVIQFTKSKFHTAREVEHYQHDILNRMLSKQVSLVALPSSNFKLTHVFSDYKDHPFSWWEKKGVQLGVGTDNYITLNTNYLQEMLILLYTDSEHLKITKLLMVATGENRRPYMSSLLWNMRKSIVSTNNAQL